MPQRKNKDLEGEILNWLDRHWRLVVVVSWLLFCASCIYLKWSDIRYFNLGDTDDNMRIMQVRALLHGQGWYDLRQYRLNPPFGANIHWSRLVDLPLAGLILGLRPFIGGAAAERWAVAIAPMLPYLLLLYSTALTTRRLVAPGAYLLAFAALMSAGFTSGMFLPERIDHHGWQLALLALSMAGIADRDRVRGGITLGLSSALSLAIGLEMIIYLALAGVATVLAWIDDAAEGERLRAYAVSIAGATAAAFLIFASYENRHPVCDALSPVWLSDALLGGALMFGLAWASPADWKRRLVLALFAAAVIAEFHVRVWPHCVQRLEGVSPEVERLWLSHVREALPFYRHGWRLATYMMTLPATGIIGFALLGWFRRNDRELLRRILAVALPGFAATALLFWQTGTAAVAQMLVVPGAAAIVWLLVPLVWKSRLAAVRIIGVAFVALMGLAALIPLVVQQIPQKKRTATEIAIGKANNLCNSLWGFRPVALQAKGMVFTFIDLGPRLIAVTHHDSVMGPYHRNGQQIADVMNAFRGDADQAHRLIGKYHSNYLLTCPYSSTTTIFMSEAPNGFYAQLEHGQVPKWLSPVDLPKDSPFKMWRVVG